MRPIRGGEPVAMAAYSVWNDAGRPLEPAQPIRDFVGQLKGAFPRAAHLHGWGSDEAHYRAVPAEDHTPYSQTGWPGGSPRWVVFAADVMHRPDLGVDCEVLVRYWLAEARAGRMPWLKYLNWRGKQYRARGYGGETTAFYSAWPNSGHFDHVHLSARTDHRYTNLDTWNLLPPAERGEDVALSDVDAQALIWRVEAIVNNRPTVVGGPLKGELNRLAAALTRIDAQTTALTAVVEQLAIAITAAGGSVDTAAILAGVDARLAALADRQRGEVRDAVADLGEGGASQVRADG